MNATDGFAEFVARRKLERENTVKVTWRRVSEDTGGGWSGLGPGGALVFVRKGGRLGYVYGHRYGKRTVTSGERRTLTSAKEAAAGLLESRLQP